VNDEAMHGIPGARVIRPGDLVKLDLVAEKDDFYTDSAHGRPLEIRSCKNGTDVEVVAPIGNAPA